MKEFRYLGIGAGLVFLAVLFLAQCTPDPPPTAESSMFMDRAVRRAEVIRTCPNGQIILQDPVSKRLLIQDWNGQMRLVAPMAVVCS